jgi:uncharacterized membrane protein
MKALARVQPAQGIAAMNSINVMAVAAGAEGHWRRYVAEWTRWNHVRVVAALAAAAAYTEALLVA